MVPHTWQVEPGTEEHYGPAWYAREFEAPEAWRGSHVRIEFESVFHTAAVRVNGTPVGEHRGAGYTAFTVDITSALRFGARNRVEVEVTNAFDENILPRGRSSDWAHDGGIYRPVRLLVTPPVFVERLEIDAAPSVDFREATIAVRALVRNTLARQATASAFVVIREEASGLEILRGPATAVPVGPGTRETISLPPVQLRAPKLWHFDHPHMYTAEVILANAGHSLSSNFGVRRFEVRDTAFFLNGERVFLMGVERMAGSHPDFGMAEPPSWIAHDHDDLKELNCVYTRVHWPQDARVLDECDRKGMLIQLEVPAWGPKTFEGMKGAPSKEILENGLKQLREMIARDRNHPSVVTWGVCNEVNGQNPPAAEFVRALAREAKRLDPSRTVSYASHSLFKTPEKDVAGELDIVEWNQYFGSWQKGCTEELRATLEQLLKAYPKKPVVISEYGYCACTADRPEDDAKRMAVLREQTELFRKYPQVAGLIFFCYNDYRTHIGDKGAGALKQRVHGVVDVYGERKPTFPALAEESSPIESLTATGKVEQVAVRLQTRSAMPAYTLRGYRLRVIGEGRGRIPLERQEFALPELKPGSTLERSFRLTQPGLERVRIEVVRPTGFGARSAVLEFA
jgi:beta-glucuronidase